MKLFLENRPKEKFALADDLTPAEKAQIRTNINTWINHSGGRLRVTNITVTRDGNNWVRANATFRNASGTQLISFYDALRINATTTLEAGFQRKFLLGILASESSFGTVFTPYTNDQTACGGFQIIPARALAEFNADNTPTYTGQQIDGNRPEFDTACKVASWFFAKNLQYFTFRRVNGVDIGSINDYNQAVYFAIACYNQGIGNVLAARVACRNAGLDNTIWENVKMYMSVAARKYVAKVVMYGDGLDGVVYYKVKPKAKKKVKKKTVKKKK